MYSIGSSGVDSSHKTYITILYNKIFLVGLYREQLRQLEAYIIVLFDNADGQPEECFHSVLFILFRPLNVITALIIA